MSTATTDQILTSPQLPKGFFAMLTIFRLGIFPTWLLWLVIFWENWVNLRIDAPYTDKFLAAPILVALAKMALLGAAAILVTWLLSILRHQTTIWKSQTGILLRNWLDCWFLSSVTMAFLNWFFDTQPNYESPTGGGRANPDMIFDFFTNGLTGQISYANFGHAVESFTLYTLFCLLSGGVVYLIVQLIVLKMGYKTNTMISGESKLDNIVGFLQLTFVLLTYSLLNGFFATIIRT